MPREHMEGHTTGPVADRAVQPIAQGKRIGNQVRGRLRQLKGLYDSWLVTEEFYASKVAECEAVE